MASLSDLTTRLYKWLVRSAEEQRTKTEPEQTPAERRYDYESTGAKPTPPLMLKKTWHW